MRDETCGSQSSVMSSSIRLRSNQRPEIGKAMNGSSASGKDRVAFFAERGNALPGVIRADRFRLECRFEIELCIEAGGLAMQDGAPGENQRPGRLAGQRFRDLLDPAVESFV